MKIYIGSDHAGFGLKTRLVAYLQELHHEVEDKGPFGFDANDDYPELLRPVAEAVAKDAGSRGVVIGKTGEGEAMIANRTKGVRAAVWYGGNIELLKLSREHNDANILSLGADFISEKEAKDAVKLWLETAFSNDPRHIRRIAELDQ